MSRQPNPETLAAIGQRVAGRRVTLGKSQKSFAHEAGIDVKTLRSLENGERWPHDWNRAKIEDALGWGRDTMDIIPTILNNDEDEPSQVMDLTSTAASGLTDSELMAELAYRFRRYSRTDKES